MRSSIILCILFLTACSKKAPESNVPEASISKIDLLTGTYRGNICVTTKEYKYVHPGQSQTIYDTSYVNDTVYIAKLSEDTFRVTDAKKIYNVNFGFSDTLNEYERIFPQPNGNHGYRLAFWANDSLMVDLSGGSFNAGGTGGKSISYEFIGVR